MMVPFLAKDAYADKFDEAFTKQWRDMTDDQVSANFSSRLVAYIQVRPK